MIKLFKPFIAPSVPDKVKDVLLSGELTQGAVVDAFEDKLRQVCKTPNVCTTNSATSAIHLALTLIKQEIEQEENIGRFEVLCPPLTCLYADSPIQLEDGTTKPISWIVNNKYSRKCTIIQ